MEEESSSSYMCGAASLLEQLDKRIMIILRDGRHFVGKLRSFDHFMNLILEETYERVLITGKYCDVPLGLYIVRGDSIVLLGEIDADKEENSMNLEKIEPADFIALPADASDASNKVEWDFES
mmetsp:Transcript_20099/g.19402  ORF Transcript_20099/g.19402 Transcript_20099/m.19402 type:complete len:123 (-) Transcript_20099:99-467(-)